MEELKKYTGRFQAFWDNYFWAKEQIEHRKNTIGLESTPEEKIKIKEYWSGLRTSPFPDTDSSTPTHGGKISEGGHILREVLDCIQLHRPR